MVDFQSQMRIHFSGPTTTVPREPLPSYRLYSTEFMHRNFKHYHPPAHHCRLQSFCQREEQPHWPVFLLSFGLKETCASVAALNDKPSEKESHRLKCCFGRKGSEEGHFLYPRAISTLPNGDVVVADTDNHRIVVYNNGGVFKTTSGQEGSEKGQFIKPHAVVGLSNGSIAVADSQHKRIQIFRGRHAQLRFCYATKELVIALATDDVASVYALTQAFGMEIYARTGNLASCFTLTQSKRLSIPCRQTSIAVDRRKNLIFLCDPRKRTVFINNFQGQLMHYFEPLPCLSGLSMAPLGIAVNPLNGHLIIGDSLNHTVNEYVLESGSVHLSRCLVGPSAKLGSFQDFALSWDGGNLVCCEFAANDHKHQVKLFALHE